MTFLEGIDVSRWQGTTPPLTGLSFLFARATYGTFGDPMYDTHIANAKKRGLVTGAYHFGRSGNVAGQVATFLTKAGNVNLYVLDLESDGANPPMSNAEAQQFIARVKAAGKVIGLYHSQSGYPQLGQMFDWVAKWSSIPPSTGWEFWQYQGSPLDRDRFNGDLIALKRLARLPVPPPKYRVHIAGPTRLYNHPNGTVVGAVTLATYICSLSKVNGLWWYRILTRGDGKPTSQAGRSFKPNRHTSSEVIYG